MTKGRLEAFSDGVLAIIITIMVLELKVPHGADVSALVALWPVFLSYVLSFIYVGIYWNNHHHLMHAVHQINGSSMWANSHLLFWLSLIPFTTGWMGENGFAPIPVAIYGVNLFLSSIAYYILVRTLIANGNSTVAKAIGNDRKGLISTGLYILGMIVACSVPWIAMAFYVAVAVIWFVPDRRIEKSLEKH